MTPQWLVFFVMFGLSFPSTGRAADLSLSAGWMQAWVGFEVSGYDLSTSSPSAVEAKVLAHFTEDFSFDGAYRLVFGSEGVLLHGPAAHLGWVFWGDPRRHREKGEFSLETTGSYTARVSLGAAFDRFDLSQSVVPGDRRAINASALKGAAVLPELTLDFDYAFSRRLALWLGTVVTPPLTNPALNQTLWFASASVGARFLLD